VGPKQAERPRAERFAAGLADSITTSKLDNGRNWLSPGSTIDKTPPGAEPESDVGGNDDHVTVLCPQRAASGGRLNITEVRELPRRRPSR
jgi:hypothetical protein